MSIFDGLPAIFTGALGDRENSFTLRRPGAADVTFTGIWTARYHASEAGVYADIDMATAAVDASLADVGEIADIDDALIDYRSKTYRILSMQADEAGMVKLILSER